THQGPGRADHARARPPPMSEPGRRRAVVVGGGVAGLATAALLAREAGKTLFDAQGELREAVDFLRYYAAQARDELSGYAALARNEASAAVRSARDPLAAGAAPAPGGVALDSGRPLGPIVCISPWNFPLAIFTGQIAGALAAGNAVLAKPAEQTPLVAMQATRLLRAAGIPDGALQLLPGRGETVGAALVADARIRGVVFTGSLEVARSLQRSLAGRLDERGRPLTLVAETGGQNAMIVDSSALAEQAVADILVSAFDSAGQRCSALRVLCVQEDGADRLLAMLRGAMGQLRIGAPEQLSTDVGPVIDADARGALVAHIEAMRARGHSIHQPGLDDRAQQAIARGTFVPPTLIELGSVAELDHEVFGPVLHVLRYPRRDLARVVEQINKTGYGLTLGIHTRIDETVDFIVGRARVGNQYVNRNMIGAVVGVQPFGGEGLSGTGPKAGGPLYVPRLAGGADAPFTGAGEQAQGLQRLQSLVALQSLH
ncbi:MAG: L-glutamate gamma-semialdehyde dehydrogenase, partial [Gammaproteobacteria bacterium]